jgi:ubiquinol-cytochrome c reductase subunit 6
VSAATPWSHVEAEAVSGGSRTDKTPAQKDDGGEGEAIVSFFHVHSMSTRRL